MTQVKDFEKLESHQRWFVNIGITLLVLIVGGWVRSEIRTDINKDMIEVINNNYMPYDVFCYSLESNQKLINIITSIESKDDTRYNKAIEDWNNLQQMMIKNSKPKLRELESND